MLRRSTTLVLLGLFCFELCLTAPAGAENITRAKRLFRQAEKQFASKEYQQALELYQKAYKAKPLPGFQLNIGQCYRNLGRCDKALEHYRQYVAASKNPKHRGDAEKLIQFCMEELARGQQPPPPSPAEQVSPVEQPPDLRGRAPQPRRASQRRPVHRVHRAVFWTGVGLTAASLAAGTITGVLALRKSSQFNDLSTPASDLRGLKDSGEMLRTSSTALFCAGAAVAVGTTVLFFFTDFGRKEVKVAAAPVAGGGVVVLGGKF